MILRSEQRTIVDQAKVILQTYGLVYIAAEVRTGKTLIALSLANEPTHRVFNKVLFITKLKAIPSIEQDYYNSGYRFDVFKVTNFEQISKIEHNGWDLIIVDEAHGTGAYPKPAKRAKDIKAIAGNAEFILLSGTPSPESHSQLYHQFWCTGKSPFKEINFYKWSKIYVDVREKWINAMRFNDYSHAKEEEIKAVVAPYMVTLSQEEAGFTSFVTEEILTVAMNPDIYKLMDRLKKDKVYKGKVTIIADTPVKLQSLFHQISSGTVKIDEKRYILDRSKTLFIKERFVGQKIAVFYQFIQEGEALRQAFPNSTDSPEIFNSTDTTFICQIVSGREGVNLSSADAIVMYNIAFSATSYWQVRARIQTKDRVKASKLYWIFSDHGIERDIHQAVSRKKNYTLDYFKKTLKTWSQNFKQESLEI